MTPGARVQAAIEILDQIGADTAAEQALTNWARRSRFAGSKDRAAVRDHVFDALRQWRSAAATGGGKTGRAIMLGLLSRQGADLSAVFHGEGHAPGPLTEAEHATLANPPILTGAEAADIPDWLWPDWQASLGENAGPIGQVLQSRADVFLRVNLGRADRKAAMAELADDDIDTVPVPGCDTALRITRNPRRLTASTAMQKGLIDVQDTASQTAVARLAVGRQDRVLDYCAGGGGKSVAMADMFGAKVFAHDVDPARMTDIPRRAHAAGVSVDVLPAGQGGDQAPYDLVLCDAPCSGSGTWRRSPDAKWRLTPERLRDLTQTQSRILDTAATLVRPKGRLAYATCSVLDAENRQVVDAFMQRQSGWQVTDELRLLPDCNHDGFYLCVFSAPPHNQR